MGNRKEGFEPKGCSSYTSPGWPFVFRDGKFFDADGNEAVAIDFTEYLEWKPERKDEGE